MYVRCDSQTRLIIWIKTGLKLHIKNLTQRGIVEDLPLLQSSSPMLACAEGLSCPTFFLPDCSWSASNTALLCFCCSLHFLSCTSTADFSILSHLSSSHRLLQRPLQVAHLSFCSIQLFFLKDIDLKPTFRIKKSDSSLDGKTAVFSFAILAFWIRDSYSSMETVMPEHISNFSDSASFLAVSASSANPERQDGARIGLVPLLPQQQQSWIFSYEFQDLSVAISTCSSNSLSLLWDDSSIMYWTSLLSLSTRHVRSLTSSSFALWRSSSSHLASAQLQLMR